MTDTEVAEKPRRKRVRRKSEEAQDEFYSERAEREIEEHSVEYGARSRYAEVGEYLTGFNAYPKLTSKDHGEADYLMALYKHADSPEERREARDLLVYRNRGLVLKIAFRYTGRGLALLDLMQVGFMGLMHALEKFDMERGFRLTTYATQWIKQHMSRAIQDMSNKRPYRIPVHKQEQMQFVRQASAALSLTLERLPNPVEILLWIKKSKPGDERAITLTLKGVKEALALVIGDTQSTSLSEHFQDEHGTSHELGDMIVSRKTVNPAYVAAARDELAVRSAEIKTFFDVLKELPPREAMVLRLRRGLMDGLPPLTLEEIGQRYQLTRERVRQLEKRALERLEAAGVRQWHDNGTDLAEEPVVEDTDDGDPDDDGDADGESGEAGPGSAGEDIDE